MSDLFGFGFANIMRHLEGDLDREFYLTHVLSVFEPRGLIDEFLNAVFLNGIGIDGGFFQLAEEFGSGRFGMAVEDILSDERLVVGLAVYLDGFLVQVEAFALAVAYGDGDGEFFKIFLHGEDNGARV